MIQLTRLRHGDTFFVNPDLIERIDTHVDTVVRLTNGTEYVVVETGDEIVRRTGEFRAQILALASFLQERAFENATSPTPAETRAAAVLERWAYAHDHGDGDGDGDGDEVVELPGQPAGDEQDPTAHGAEPFERVGEGHP
ncbi:MAG: flagellar FlbD family protein [Ilumatobacter sp.]|uniref:flagellar FlbD family protein n=1 Tax=Ilumatobacter sp. TaxID=1967498 RepID=UPI002614D602|nr:flagellar FlbD family protein [Ilumatobacter sp.]MDJ0767427.1 flagellar FlbD family protein [Ilumatobacter sp.]